MQARTEQSGAALNIERLVLTTLMIFAFGLFWNSLVRGIILRDAQFALEGNIRPAAERNLWLSLTLTLALALVFTVSFARCAPRGGLRHGLLHGTIFAILAGLLVDLNLYLVYPIPAFVAGQWFVSGLLEFLAYGLIAGRLYSATPPVALAAG